MYKKLLGAYRDRNLPVYRLHPVVKMLTSFSFVLAAGLVKSLPAMILLIAVFFILGALAGLKPQEQFTMIRPFRFLLIFTFVVQLFLTPMGQWILPDWDALYRSTFFTLRMVLIIGFSAIFAVITPVSDIVRLFYLIFQPLKIFKISPADTAMSMMLALRFIPLLFTEGEKIIDAQRLKGVLPAKEEKVPFALRVKSSLSLVVPLFVRTFYYAEQIGTTLNYRHNNSAFFKLPSASKADFAAAVLIVLLAAGVVFVSKIS